MIVLSKEVKKVFGFRINAFSMHEFLTIQHNNMQVCLTLIHDSHPNVEIFFKAEKAKSWVEVSSTKGFETPQPKGIFGSHTKGTEVVLYALTPQRALIYFEALFQKGWRCVPVSEAKSIDWSNPFLGRIDHICLPDENSICPKDSFQAFTESGDLLLTITKQGLIALLNSKPTQFKSEV